MLSESRREFFLLLPLYLDTFDISLLQAAASVSRPLLSTWGLLWRQESAPTPQCWWCCQCMSSQCLGSCNQPQHAPWDEGRSQLLGSGCEASLAPVNLLTSLTCVWTPVGQITHPAGCMSQFIRFFGEQIMVLWKLALLRRRILIFSPPPVGVVCYRGEKHLDLCTSISFFWDSLILAVFPRTRAQCWLLSLWVFKPIMKRGIVRQCSSFQAVAVSDSPHVMHIHILCSSFAPTLAYHSSNFALLPLSPLSVLLLLPGKHLHPRGRRGCAWVSSLLLC